MREISSILPIMTQGTLDTPLVESFITEKMNLIDQRINTLQQLRTRLASLPLGNNCPLRRDCGDL